MTKAKQMNQQTEETARDLVVAQQHVITPPEMLAKALQKGLSPEVLSQLMALQERWQANEAKKAFNLAMAAAKAEIKPVRKNRRVHFKSKDAGKADTDYRHEDFAAVSEAVGAAFANHGLEFRFRTEQPAPGAITVTCVISHRDGHSEENSLSSTVDTSGNKNHLQAIGSAQTYLQRYTLKAAVGLAASNDDDGHGAGGDAPVVEVITSEQAEKINTLLKQKGRTVAQFLKWACDGTEKLEQLPADLYEECIAALGKLPDAKI